MSTEKKKKTKKEGFTMKEENNFCPACGAKMRSRKNAKRDEDRQLIRDMIKEEGKISAKLLNQAIVELWGVKIGTARMMKKRAIDEAGRDVRTLDGFHYWMGDE